MKKDLLDLEKISLELIERILEILDEFGLEYTYNEKSVSMPCPLHGGDNPGGLSILLSGIGNWQCFTHQCHEIYDSSIIGFIQGLLTTEYNRDVTRSEAIQWSSRFTGITQQVSTNNTNNTNDTTFINLHKYICTKKEYITNFIPRKVARQHLKIPAPQFLNRYSRAILIDYDIGLCINSKKSMYNRIVVPFYDESGEYMIGCSGRSIYDKCVECKRYHNPKTRCPITQEEKINASKWKHSGKFNAEMYLYNYWRAKEYIKNGIAILVEGPGDVWRLEESDIHCGLALLGTKFTDEQLEELEKMQILHLIIATDNDEAGEKARKNIERKCRRLFNIHHFIPDGDIGDMTIGTTRNQFYPLLEKINKRNHILC